MVNRKIEVKAGGVQRVNRIVKKTSKLRKKGKASDEEYNKCWEIYQLARRKFKFLEHSKQSGNKGNGNQEAGTILFKGIEKSL